MERTRTKDGKFAAEHNGRGTPLYRVWMAMNERCNNPHNKRYDRYGGRGIKVATTWKDFANFRDWSMANGYAPGLTIDRINNDLGYAPSNCRWVTRKAQNRNYSRNLFLTYNGETLCLKEWAERTGVNRSTIVWRLNHGKTIQEALTKIDNRFK